LTYATAINFDLSLAVTSRINGFDGKVAIIKDAVLTVWSFPEEIIADINATLSAAEEHKRYRDSVIHARPLTSDSAVAPANANRGTTYETIVTVEALNALYDRVISIYHEMIEVTYIVMLYAAIPDVEGSVRQPYEDTARSCVAQLRHYQYLRSHLPPLPEFPAEYRVRPKTAKPPEPQG
jgi:hypothetical protein